MDCDDRFETLLVADATARATVVRPGAAAAVALDPIPADMAPTYAHRRLSPDGRWAAEVYGSPFELSIPLLRVWAWAAGRKAVDERAPVHSATQLDFHPTRPEMCVADPENRVRVVDLTTGRTLARSEPGFGGPRLRYAPDGRTVAVTSAITGSAFLDARTLARAGRGPAVGPTDAVAWGPDGNTVAFGTFNGQVYLWDRAARAGRFLPGAHRGSVVDLRFAPDGRTLASVGLDNQTRLWDPRGNRFRLAVPGVAIRFAPDGRRLVVADDDRLVVYELAFRDEVRALPGTFEGAEFSPDGALLAVFGPGGAHLLAADTLGVVADLPVDDCGAVAFRPDGGALLTVTRFTGPWVWPVRPAGDGTAVGPPYPLFPEERPGELANRLAVGRPMNDGRQAAWSRDGTLLVLPDRRGRVVHRADPAGKAAPRVFAPLYEPHRVAVSPDGRWVAGSNTESLGTRVWDRDGNAVLEVPGHQAAAFSPDDRWLATAGRYDVHVYRAGTWEHVHTYRRAEVDAENFPALAFQPVGGLLAFVTSRHQIRLADPDTGEVAANLTHPEPVVAVRLSFSPDGTRLAVTRPFTDVVVWDLARVADGLADLGLDPGRLRAPAGPRAGPPRPVRVDRGGTLPGPQIASTRWKNLAWWESAKGNYPGAVLDATRAIDTAPPDPKARAGLHVARGQYQWRCGSHAAARDDWQTALELDPASADAALWLARLWALGPTDLSNPRRALALVGPLAEPADAPPQAVLTLAPAQARLERYQLALDTFRRLTGDAGGPVREYVRAVCLFHLGQQPAAREALAAARTWDDRQAPRRGRAESEEVAAARVTAEAVVK
jgi:WD40 repeat protein